MKETTHHNTIFTVNGRSLKPTTVYYNYNRLIVIIQELRCHWALTAQQKYEKYYTYCLLINTFTYTVCIL